MAKDTQIHDDIVDLQADVICTALDNGYLRIYAGSKPATAMAALSGETLLAELRFAATSEASVVDGLITFAALTADTNANNTGTAAYFRAFKSDGTTVVMDGTVGTSDANLILGTTTINAGQTVSVTSLTHDVKNAQSGL